MRKIILTAAVLFLGLTQAMAQADPPASATKDPLSIDQQRQIGEIITNSGPTALADRNLSLAVGNAVPAELALRPLPAPAVQVAPQLQGLSYLMIDEEIALIDPRTRKIVTVIPRWRSQETDAKR
jgi:Protein of unknown function (DUF1236)